MGGFEKGHVAGVAAGGDDDKAIGGTHAGCIDQMPGVLQPDLRHGVEIGRGDAEAIDRCVARGNAGGAGEAAHQVCEIAAHPFAGDECINGAGCSTRTARNIGDFGIDPIAHGGDFCAALQIAELFGNDIAEQICLAIARGAQIGGHLAGQRMKGRGLQILQRDGGARDIHLGAVAQVQPLALHMRPDPLAQPTLAADPAQRGIFDIELALDNGLAIGSGGFNGQQRRLFAVKLICHGDIDSDAHALVSFVLGWRDGNAMGHAASLNLGEKPCVRKLFCRGWEISGAVPYGGDL